MRVNFNPTGTHIQKGFLKIRVDLYPEPQDATYALHYVDHYDREPTEAESADEALLALVPTHKELNPCLCHFIKVDADASLAEVRQYVEDIFDKTTLKQLDSLLSQPQTDHPALGQLMRTKSGEGSADAKDQDVGVLNTRLSSLEVRV